jgi:hypothetical protein
MPHQDKNHSYHQDMAMHHGQSAVHHEHAAKSHREAARMREAGNHGAANMLALAAHAHTLQALQYSEDALMAHANIQMSVERP